MKKKGLIIATIVMVLVLAVSLTTATYAWFNASAATTVDNVTVSVASASNISIGILSTYGSTRSSATNYVNGTISYTETDTAANQGKGQGAFESAEEKVGLGTKVSWNWSLSSIGGVSSSADGESFDPTYTPANKLYNGSYTNDSPDTPVIGTIATYNVQTDLENDVVCSAIYAPFGLRVEKPDLNYLYCDITITADNANFWGIVTALKLEISSTNGSWSGHPFNEWAATPTAVKDGLMAADTTYQTAPPSGTKKVVFRFVVASDTSDPLAYGETSSIYTFDIRMFIDGTDSNCIADATQYNATIGLAFDALSTSDYGSLADATRVITL